MASFAVAGVFTYARIVFFISPCIKELIFIGFEYLKVFLACMHCLYLGTTLSADYNITIICLIHHCIWIIFTNHILKNIFGKQTLASKYTVCMLGSFISGFGVVLGHLPTQVAVLFALAATTGELRLEPRCTTEE